MTIILWYISKIKGIKKNDESDHDYIVLFFLHVGRLLCKIFWGLSPTWFHHCMKMSEKV
jgi:hypothetical protein